VSNQITLGNSSITSLRCNVTTISSLSDQRDKVNIVDSQYGLETLEKVKVRQFDWATRRGSIKDGTSEIGFIAQELQEVGDNNLLKLVMDDNPEFLEASPASLIPILVKAVQELSEKVKELESR
jgi:trimeric autotransporter adhesin